MCDGALHPAQAVLRKLSGEVPKKPYSIPEKGLVFTRLFQLRFHWLAIHTIS
jgi:hypothetical protein